MRTVRLFVYGSLKRGGRHHAELQGARFLGEARTEPGYALVALGEYLALERREMEGAGLGPRDAEAVTGELFELSESLLPALDAFEGEDYGREELWLTLIGPGESGEKCLALAYLKRTR